MDQDLKKFQLLLDNQLNIVKAEPKFFDYVGQPMPRCMDDVIPPQDLLLMKNTLFALEPGSGNLCCFRIRTARGKLNWIAANIQKTDDDSKQIIAELSDIQSFKSVGPSASFDVMTGLLNKETITGYAQKMVEEPGKGFYFALVDIDHFKRVNDTLGHKKGDEVIIDVAHMIRDIIGSNGRVGRIGGDEFMIVLDKVNQRPRLREIMNELKDSVEQKYAAMEDALHITLSVGVTLYPDYSDDYEELFTLTDKLLYRAKEKGRNRYVIYTPEVHAAIRGKEEDIQAAAPRHVYTEKEKKSLMLDLMDKFLMSDKTNVDVALTDMLNAYNMDEIHVINENNTESHYGVCRDDSVESGSKIFLRSFPFLSEVPQDMYNENNMLLQATETYTDLKKTVVRDYMEANKLRFYLMYHMTESRIPGYVIFMNYQNSSNRPSESDISDLLYFGRMMELVLRTR
ncbi:MAG: GGDEF domain-containing protein [Lachnospiraceae bacterium]|nr:GGDEF domain-containing protein [Lachnospiraceae bacterium]